MYKTHVHIVIPFILSFQNIWCKNVLHRTHSEIFKKSFSIYVQSTKIQTLRSPKQLLGEEKIDNNFV